MHHRPYQNNHSMQYGSFHSSPPYNPEESSSKHARYDYPPLWNPPAVNSDSNLHSMGHNKTHIDSSSPSHLYSNQNQAFSASAISITSSHTEPHNTNRPQGMSFNQESY
jgi:hypothetical protein